MGYSTERIAFIDDNARVHVIESTHAAHCGRNMTVGAFANGRRLRTERVCETGEILATRDDGAFILGQPLGDV